MSQLSPGERIVVSIVFLFLMLPVVPIGLGWYRATSSRADGKQAGFAARVVLVLVSVSQALLMIGLVVTNVIGPHYSSRRYATIYVNLGVMLAGTAIAAVTRGRVRCLLVASCAWVSCSWFYMAVVSSVV